MATAHEHDTGISEWNENLEGLRASQTSSYHDYLGFIFFFFVIFAWRLAFSWVFFFLVVRWSMIGMGHLDLLKCQFSGLTL